MAFLPKRQETQNQTGAPALSGDLAQSFSSNAASAPTRGGGGNSTNTSSPGAVPSAPWGNISEYLRANQGQSGQLAGKIAGGLTDLYGKTTGDINQTGQNFQGLVDQNKVSYDSGLVENAANDPTRFVQNQGDVDKFKRIYNANYGGPASFSQSDDYAKLQGDVQKAQERAGLANQGYAGIQQLVGGFQKNPTQGIRSLDTLLLQQDPNNAQTIRNAATPFQGLKDFLLGKSTTLDKSATDAAQETADAKQQAQERFIGEQGAVKQFENRINQQLQDAAQKKETYNTNVAQNKILAQPIDTAVKNFINRNPWIFAGQAFKNPADAINAAKEIMKDPTLASVASQDDFATDAALQQLIDSQIGLNDAESSQAGTFGAVPESALIDQRQLANKAAEDAFERMYRTGAAGGTSYYGQATPYKQMKDLYGNFFDSIDPYSDDINASSYGNWAQLPTYNLNQSITSPVIQRYLAHPDKANSYYINRI